MTNGNGNGRPPWTEWDRLQVRLPPEDREAIYEEARRRGYSLSSLVRFLAAHARECVYTLPPEDREAISEEARRRGCSVPYLMRFLTAHARKCVYTPESLGLAAPHPHAVRVEE